MIELVSSASEASHFYEKKNLKGKNNGFRFLVRNWVFGHFHLMIIECKMGIPYFPLLSSDHEKSPLEIQGKNERVALSWCLFPSHHHILSNLMVKHLGFLD